jgi:hypothetical protein
MDLVKKIQFRHSFPFRKLFAQFGVAERFLTRLPATALEIYLPFGAACSLYFERSQAAHTAMSPM